MKQGVLPFQYEQEKSSPGMTAMAGMMTYLELMHAAGLRSSVERHVGLRECGQGWTDSQVVSSLILLNLAGGESVVDLDVLEKDAGLCRVLREVESYGMGRRERRALEERWRVERRRSMPSESAVFRYLERFHEAGEESSREAHRAFIPSPNEALGGLHKVNADMVSFVQSRSPCAQATLDMYATLVETHKQQALYSYKKYKAYQPLTTYWAEAELIVHSEFRDGNVPAGYQQLRVLTEALEHLPCAVDKVMLRSDAAGYQHELLRYCAEGRDERFGVIEFAVGLNVTPEFRRAVSEVAEQDWHAPHRRLGATWVETGQQWAEVNFVPDWIAYSKKNPEYRFIAIREPLSEQPLPGMELQLELPFPVMRLAGGAWHKVSGLVTNRDLPGDEMIRWYRQRCGKGEQVHSVLKSDPGCGQAPVGAVRSQRRMVGHSGAGLQPELCDEAAGVGRTVGEQASQGSALRPDRPSGPGDATRQEADHPSGAGPSLIRVVDQGTSEDIGAVRRAVPTISGPVCASVEGDSARSPRLGHAFFGLRTAIIGAATLPIPSKSSAKVLPTARSDHMEPPNRYSTRA